MDDRVLAAARNNALWCDLVCRSHGLPTVSSDHLWIAPEGSPRLYPDAITLAPGMDADAVLSDIRLLAGSSVKDSFADLELGAHGFVELFEASWFFRPAAAPQTRPSLRWAAITTEEELTSWSVAADQEDTFGPRLLHDPTVQFLAVKDDQGAGGGALINRTGPLLGVSNVFTAGISLDAMWSDLPAAVADSFDRLPLVGYERGEQLASAQAAGFAALAPLRVWLKPGE